MEASQAELLRNFTQVTRRFEQLSQRLTEVAEQAKIKGMLPSESLVDHIATSRQSFNELRDQALELVCLLAASTAKAPGDIESIKDLEALLRFIAEAQRKKTQEDRDRVRALTILDRLLSLMHREQAEFRPLQEAQAKAKTLRDQLRSQNTTDVHPDMMSLAQGRHPLAELLTLAEAHDKLDDDLWLLLKHAVAEHFGQSLALCAARGKLVPGRLTTDRCDHKGGDDQPPPAALPTVSG